MIIYCHESRSPRFRAGSVLAACDDLLGAMVVGESIDVEGVKDMVGNDISLSHFRASMNRVWKDMDALFVTRAKGGKYPIRIMRIA